MPRPNVSEQRKREIVQAAAMVFTTQGLAAARMEDVAAAAGISKGTIYLYYPSKDALIEALLRQLFQPLDAALEHLMTSDALIRERLWAYGLETLRTFEGARPLHPLILELFALARRQTFAGALFASYFTRYRDGLASILRESAASGGLSLAAFADDASQAALSYMAAVEGILILTLINPDLLDLERDGGAVLHVWLRQV
jgi:AcrR family transcriptional regulator